MTLTTMLPGGVHGTCAQATRQLDALASTMHMLAYAVSRPTPIASSTGRSSSLHHKPLALGACMPPRCMCM